MRFVTILLVALVCLPLVSAADVEVGTYVLNLGKFDVGTGTFTADFYLSLKCDDCAEKINGSMVQTIPFESFEFVNGRATSVDKIIDEPTEKFYRIQANLNSPVDLKEFPFDRQSMQILLEHKSLTLDDLEYIPDKEISGIDESVVFTGWRLEGWDAKVTEHEYKVYDETYSQYVFSVPIERIAANSFLKTFLPVIFMITVVLFSFLLDPDKITTRLGMVGSSLVASVMFHVSISNQIPPVGYLTFADKFMILTYGVLLASFLTNIAMLELGEQKKEETVKRIHTATEWTMFIIVPLLYITLFLWRWIFS